MPARIRKALGAAALLLYICGFIVLAIWLSDLLLGGAPIWLQLVYFAVAGIIWVAPLKPLFRWMNNSG